MLKRILPLVLFLWLGMSNWANAQAQAQLLFEVSREKIWSIGVMDADGQNARVLTNLPQNIQYHEYSPVWSPDGQRIAFTALTVGSPAQVRVMNRDGTNVQQPTEPLGFRHAQYPTWSADGKSLAFVVDEDPDPGTVNIYRVDSDGKNPKRLTQSAHKLNVYPAWSPDGSKIAFTRADGKGGSSEIYVMDASGENEKPLTNSGDERFPTWSPDGSRIVYIHTERLVNPPLTRFHLWVMNADGSLPRRLEIPNAPMDLADRMGHPLWLPDGRVLFHKVGNSEVYTVDPEGTNLTQLFDLKQVLGLEGMSGVVTVTSWFDPLFARPVQPRGKLPMLLGQVKAATLWQNYPNPFNPDTWIPFELSVDGSVTIQIHDVQGYLIRTLGLGSREAGVYLLPSQAAYWDGHNQAGQSVASGVYFYTLHVGQFSETRRMVVLK